MTLRLSAVNPEFADGDMNAYHRVVVGLKATYATGRRRVLRTEPMTRTRRALLVIPLFLSLSGCTAARTPLALSGTEQSEIDRIAHYLDGLKSFRAQFMQAGAFEDGSGTVWLDRPGRLRIAYAGSPAKTLVAANGRVVIYDEASGGTASTLVSRTPLGILLTPTIAFSGDVTVTSFHEGAGLTELSIEKTDSPGDGSLTLYLSQAPLSLVGVLVKDGHQRPLMIRLSPLMLNPPLTPDLFQYPGPVAS
jgi:outer membrane lipoprotein-sorting protein